jgi:hypothetical protein
MARLFNKLGNNKDEAFAPDGEEAAANDSMSET